MTIHPQIKDGVVINYDLKDTFHFVLQCLTAFGLCSLMQFEDAIKGFIDSERSYKHLIFFYSSLTSPLK